MIKRPTSVLAFDFGTQKIGVALGQSLTGQARPLTTLKARAGKPDWSAVSALYAQWQPDYVVVGLPLNMDGTESDSCQRARKFARRLSQHIDKSVTFADERLSSFEARARAKGDKQHSIDAHAAALIAETWLAQNL